jgi:sulfite reductase (NADPH) hemoprotein beta-component
VARIAYLASDVIVSVQPSLEVDSDFSAHLNRYAERKDRSLVAAAVGEVPEVWTRLFIGDFSSNY